MNPAYNKTLNLLVEIKSNIPGKGDGSERKKVDLGPLGQAKPSFTMSTEPKPSSDEGPTVSRNNQSTLDFLKPRPGEQETPKKDPLYDRIVKALKGAGKRFGSAMKKFGRRKGK